jgi:hypothetical protein
MEKLLCTACASGYHESPGAGDCPCPCHGNQPRPEAPASHPWKAGCTCPSCQAYKLTCHRRQEHIHFKDFPESGSSGPASDQYTNLELLDLAAQGLKEKDKEDAKALAFVKECGYQVQGLVGYDKVTAVELLIALGRALHYSLSCRAKQAQALQKDLADLRATKIPAPASPECATVVYLAVSLTPLSAPAPNPAPGGPSPAR